jgi:carbon starvation protein CstA
MEILITSLSTLPLFLFVVLFAILIPLGFLFTALSVSVRAEKRKLQEAIDEAERPEKRLKIVRNKKQ